jgi:hypothetical protein
MEERTGSVKSGTKFTFGGMKAVVVRDNGDSITFRVGTDQIEFTVRKEHLSL